MYFIVELVTKGEVRRLSQVRVDYDEIMRGYRREVDVTLTTATPLSEERLTLLKRSVQNDYLKPEDNLIFAHSIDDSIVGGYKVYIKGQEHDLSWASAVRVQDESSARVLNLPRDALSKAPRGVSTSASDAVALAQAEKDVQGWLPNDLFARTIAAESARAVKPVADKAKLIAALKAAQ